MLTQIFHFLFSQFNHFLKKKIKYEAFNVELRKINVSPKYPKKKYIYVDNKNYK